MKNTLIVLLALLVAAFTAAPQACAFIVNCPMEAEQKQGCCNAQPSPVEVDCVSCAFDAEADAAPVFSPVNLVVGVDVDFLSSQEALRLKPRLLFLAHGLSEHDPPLRLTARQRLAWLQAWLN